MLLIKQFTFNPFAESTYVLSDAAGTHAIVVDPGMSDSGERDVVDRYIADEGLTLTAIVNTHLHLDHSFGINYLKHRYCIPLMAHAADASLGLAIDEQLRRFGLPHVTDNVTIDTPLSDGDSVDIGGEKLQVIHVPGHTPGGIALYSPDGKFLISGDSLFKGSIGRTDLPGGDYATLVRSVRDKLLPLPCATLVLPGHEGSTTIGDERRYNPFV